MLPKKKKHILHYIRCFYKTHSGINNNIMNKNYPSDNQTWTSSQKVGYVSSLSGPSAINAGPQPTLDQCNKDPPLRAMQLQR